MIKRVDMSDRVSASLTKIDRYNWGIKDEPGILMMISKYDLRIDSEYQRTLNNNKVREMSASWSWLACSAITVGIRDGAYWVIDGQHRVVAAMRRADITALPCVVFETEDIQDEARGFLNINSRRKPMTSVDRLRASAVAGDESAKQFESLCRRLGFALTTSGNAPGTIKCANWGMQRMSDDPVATTIVMELAASLCVVDHIMIQEKLLGGLWHIHKNCEADLTNIKLRQRIKARGARALIEEAGKAAAYYSRGGEKVWAAGMLNAINKGLKIRFDWRKDGDDA